jgi:hypothetical protein
MVRYLVSLVVFFAGIILSNFRIAFTVLLWNN